MKKFVVALLLLGMVGVCGLSTSCSSSDNMYQRKSKSSSVIKSNYKVRGNARNNGSTYRTY